MARLIGIEKHREGEEVRVGVRKKLNAANVNGALLVAGIIGSLTGSWVIFGVALAGLLISGVLGGDIRPGGGRRQKP